jgi:gliding motility-associated-like protein
VRILLVFWSCLFWSNELSAQVNLGQGLKLYLPFNGNANDLSGNGNNATVNGAVLTTDKYGYSNSAMEFDGVNDFLEIANSTSLQFTDSITMCAKVYVTGFYNGTCQSNCILTKGNNDFTNGHYSLRFGDAPYDNDCNILSSANETFYGHMKTLGAFPSGAGVGQAGAGPYIQSNQWYCVVYTWNGNTISMYVDGTLRFTYPYSNQANGTNGDKLFIGKRNDITYPFYFKGKLDDIRLYNRCLRAEEITASCTDCSYFHLLNDNILSSKDTSVCLVTPLPMSVNALPSSLYYDWQPNTGISTTNSPTPTITAAVTTTYTVFITDSNQCRAVDSIKISVFSTPPIANAGPDQTICAGAGSGSVQLNGTGGGTYVWQPPTTLNSSTLSNPTATPAGTTIYTLTVASAVGCTNSDVVTVFVSPPPTLVVSQAIDTVCFGKSVPLSASGANSYTWSGIALNGTTGPNVSATPSTNSTYTVTAASIGGCTSTATVSVLVEALPTLSITGPDSICIGDKAEVFVSGADLLQWSPASAIVPSPNGGVVITPAASQIYTVNASSVTGCTSSATYALTVSTTPQVTLSKSSDINCANKQATISASTTGYVYNWSPSGALISGQAIQVAPLNNTTYTCTAVNGKCSSTTTIDIQVTAKPPVEFYIPSAFSPNDDGNNDCFRVKIIKGDYYSFQLRVFNRWGQEVFQATDALQCWYGEQAGEVPENTDTYFYTLSIDDGCSPIRVSGAIHRLQ